MCTFRRAGGAGAGSFNNIASARSILSCLKCPWRDNVPKALLFRRVEGRTAHNLAGRYMFGGPLVCYILVTTAKRFDGLTLNVLHYGYGWPVQPIAIVPQMLYGPQGSRFTEIANSHRKRVLTRE